jgi:ribosomal protein S18 acetylase RimI-like enzyme
MTQEYNKNAIVTKEYLSEQDYNNIKQLEAICYENDHTNLKLELDYKLFLNNTAKSNSEQREDHTNSYNEEHVKEQLNSNPAKIVNEFMYYINGTLVAYLGISCFGGNIGEINGMTHPDWRRKGIFNKLFVLAAKEGQSRNYSLILMLSDGASESGIAFIKSMGGNYHHSEYRMKLMKYPAFDETSSVTLRISQNRDKKKINELNVILFQDEEESMDESNEGNKTDTLAECEIADDIDKVGESTLDNKETSKEEQLIPVPSTVIYMIEVEDVVIGKIHVEYGEHSAFLFGFGILPEYRKQGYGKAALTETLRLIEAKNIAEVSLDVVCTNSHALNLYIGCGFEQQSIMNYYQYQS